METIEISDGSDVNLIVAISTEAIVGSNVSLNDHIIKESQSYAFTTGLGNISNLNNKVLSSASKFNVALGDFDPVFNNTIVTYTLEHGGNSTNIPSEKVKASDNLFMAYFIVKLKKV